MKVNFDNLDIDRVAVISDPHFDHQREFVWEVRGYDSADHHKQSILGHLESLDSKTMLVCLGDNFLNTCESNVNSALSRIKCPMVTLWGNHPAGIKDLYYKVNPKVKVVGLGVNQEVYPLEIAYNKWVMGDDFYFTFKKKHYYCNHYPQIIWDGVQHGIPCLNGHSHGNFKQANPDETNFGKMMDCGVDNALKTVGRPFFWLDEIDAIMKVKQQKVWDHHG